MDYRYVQCDAGAVIPRVLRQFERRLCPRPPRELAGRCDYKT
jgi:hypothetical protein